MIRFLFRVVATMALAVALIMAVLDATRSILASTAVLTPLGQSWQQTSAASYDAVRNFILAKGPTVLWDPVATTVLAAPGFIVFACLALIFYAAGHRSDRRSGPRAPGAWSTH